MATTRNSIFSVKPDKVTTLEGIEPEDGVIVNLNGVLMLGNGTSFAEISGGGGLVPVCGVQCIVGSSPSLIYQARWQADISRAFVECNFVAASDNRVNCETNFAIAELISSNLMPLYEILVFIDNNGDWFQNEGSALTGVSQISIGFNQDSGPNFKFRIVICEPVGTFEVFTNP